MQEPEVGVSDAVHLNPLNEDAFLHNLQVRFKRDIIYTNGGSNMLISINPYRQLPLYSTDIIRAYLTKMPCQLPPHIYAIAASAYRKLKDRNENQCIVVTGESGSGKTEAARICLQLLVVAGGGRSIAASSLTAAGTLLEAFGNATTAINHNASRFGKYLEIAFDFKGDAIGGHITHYLLEKTRVTKLEDGDRNFHVFYQLLAGADGALLKLLKLQRSISSYRLLRCDKVPSPHRHNPSRDDKDHFLFTKNAMETLGIDSEEFKDVFKLLSFVLKMGNVEFVPATNIDGTIGCSVDNEYELYEACELVGIEPDELLSALGCGSEGVDYSEAVFAGKARDRLLPSIYGRLFAWLINRVNISLKPVTYSKRSTLGILDVYGFENLPRNSLDQLLINYTNERLQSAIVSVTLKREQEEYIKENIEWQKIQYFDNEPICELIDATGTGILSVLSECSRRTSYTYGGDDADSMFYERLQQCRAGHQHLQFTDHQEFQVHHYAGTVTYNINGFVEKNADILAVPLTACLHSATNRLLKELFPEGGGSASPRRSRPAPASCRACVCACLCVRRVTGCLSPRLLRCFLPARTTHRHLAPHVLRHQMRTQAVMEMVSLARAGYCESICQNEALSRYSILRPGVSLTQLIASLPLPHHHFVFGPTKMFIKNENTVWMLECIRTRRVSVLVSKVQRAWRAYRAKKAQSLIARAFRRYTMRKGIPERQQLVQKLHMRKKIMTMQHEKRVLWATTIIQTNYRHWMRRRYLFTLWSRLPTTHMSPLCILWPPSPVLLMRTDLLLRHIHHRWRCYKYRLNFDQTARNRMREKVTASILFKDRKQSYARSVCHPFVGDYVRLRASAAWRRACSAAPPADHYVVFADIVRKVARTTGKTSCALCVVSTGSLLLLDARSLRVRRRVPAPALYSLSLSPYRDDIIVIHVKACPFLDPDENEMNSQCSSRDVGESSGCLFGSDTSGKKKGDLMLQTCHVLEMATKLFLVVQNAVGKPPQVNIATEFEANFGQQIVTISFKLCGTMEPARIVRRGSHMDVFI